VIAAKRTLFALLEWPMADGRWLMAIPSAIRSLPAFQRIRQEMEDVLQAASLPDTARVSARVVAGDQAQLGHLLVQRPAADAV
jgi:hypothetical protein